MKSVIIILWAAICGVVYSEEACIENVIRACRNWEIPNSFVCDSRFGGIRHIEPEVQAYINSILYKSYEYLLLATNFNSYHKHRLGFQKLFQDLSDSSFDDTVELIREISRRGGKANFNVVHESPANVTGRVMQLDVDELHSLAMALDNEKQLSNAVIHVHTYALHSTERDPEMAHYLAEHFLRKHSENVRNLNSYVNNLVNLMKTNDPSFAVYSFDHFLESQ